MSTTFAAVGYEDGELILLDQTKLPVEEIYERYATVEGVADAIRTMVVRGAPAIGIAAGFGMAIAARTCGEPDAFESTMERAASLLGATRPTAVNLFWAIDRMKDVVSQCVAKPHSERVKVLEAEAIRILEEDIDVCYRIGKHGAALLKDSSTVMTHCNAGALATGGYGTALAVMRVAVEEGKTIQVIANETRPFLQGARLTTWELMRDGIDVTLVADNAAGSLIRRGLVQAVIVGTDRTVANGDVANKIGTYSVAVLAHENGIPFYVAAPTSTIDLNTKTGDEIEIEERSGEEVRGVFGRQTAPEGVKTMNPSFDVTPARYVTGIITENGVAYPPYESSLLTVMGKSAG